MYENGTLLRTITSEDKTSIALPNIINELLKTFTCKELFFVRGPGSFMAIKVTYIFLRTLSIALNLPLFACDGFAVNENSPIPAFGNLFFVKKNGKITTKHLDNKITTSMALPQKLDTIAFSDKIEPLYVLPAI